MGAKDGLEKPYFLIRLMDGFAVEFRGNQIALPLDAQRLVAFIALENRPMSRTYVAGKLWGDASQERAFGNLRSALWRVRKEVDLLTADPSSVGLCPAASTDVGRIELLASRLGRSDHWVPGPELDHRQLSGELLPGWYDEWTLVERERIRQLCLHSLESLAMRRLDAGRFTDALEAALTAIALEPLRESAHRVVIRIHLAEGNHWEAKRHYAYFTDLLASELGLQPSPVIEGLMADALVAT
jgi:DNA-binding SARP family transcriptional activator